MVQKKWKSLIVLMIAAALWGYAGEAARAEELFLDLARSYPQNPEAFINLGLLKRRQGDRSAAVFWFGRARELAPAEPRVAAFFAESGS